MSGRGSPRGWAAVGRTAITRSVLESSTAAAIPGIGVGPTAARHAGRRDAEARRFSTGMRGLCGLWLFLAQ